MAAAAAVADGFRHSPFANSESGLGMGMMFVTFGAAGCPGGIIRPQMQRKSGKCIQPGA